MNLNHPTWIAREFFDKGVFDRELKLGKKIS